jgi:hypothetical protein
LTEAILSRSTDLCHLFQSRDCHCSFRTKAEGQAVGESCPYFGGSAPDDPPSSLQILHEASERRGALWEIMEARCSSSASARATLPALPSFRDVVLGCYLVVILSKYGKQNIKQTEESLIRSHISNVSP